MKNETMNNDIQDLVVKGLIEIVRQPRAEKLAKLIRTTKAYSVNFWYWLDWLKVNRN